VISRNFNTQRLEVHVVIAVMQRERWLALAGSAKSAAKVELADNAANPHATVRNMGTLPVLFL
jgi:hypothetical protein